MLLLPRHPDGCSVVPLVTPYLCCFLAGFVLGKLLPFNQEHTSRSPKTMGYVELKREGYISPALNGV